jgi:hypothetical protein
LVRVQPGELQTSCIRSPDVRMPSARPPRLGSRRRMLEVIKTEEKGSDVNLATLPVAHAYQDRYEAAIVLSNDSDLVLPTRIVREELRLAVGILNPHKRFSAELSNGAAFRRSLREGVLAAAQFPDELTDAHGVVRKPGRWD